MYTYIYIYTYVCVYIYIYTDVLLRSVAFRVEKGCAVELPQMRRRASEHASMSPSPRLSYLSCRSWPELFSP